MSKKTLLEKCIESSLSKDETRRNLYMTVYHHEGIKKLVCTDGHKMTFSLFHYSDELKGKSIQLPYGTLNPRSFPSVEHFDISEKYDDTSMFNNSGENFKIDSIFCAKSSSKTPTRVYFLNTDNGVKLTFECPDNHDKTICAINSEFLIPFKNESVFIYWYKKESELKPLYFCLDKYHHQSWHLIMPLKL